MSPGFYKLEFLVEIPEEGMKQMDSQCDEIHVLMHTITEDNNLLWKGFLDYKWLSREEYDILSKHKVFDENGGL